MYLYIYLIIIIAVKSEHGLTLISSVAVLRNSAASLKVVIGQGTVFKQFGSVN